MKNFLVIILLLFFTQSIVAHGFSDWMAGVSISSQNKYDFKAEEYLSGININSFILLLNMSLEHPSLISGSDKTIRYHIGLGLASIFQVQYGFNYALRFRSDLVIFGDDSPLFSDISSDWWIFRKGLVISQMIDIPLKSNKSFQISLGLGLQI